MQIEDGRPRLLGRTDDEWIALWDSYWWRQRTVAALIEIAFSRDATAEDRIAALVLLNEGVKSGLLPCYPDLPDLLCRALLLINEGAHRPHWWRRIGLARRRAVISDRITGIKTTMLTISQFEGRRQLMAATEAARETAKGETESETAAFETMGN